MHRFADQGCDAVVLAPTELPRLVAGLELALPVVDTADIAARAASDVALGHRPLPTWRGGPHPDLPRSAGAGRAVVRAGDVHASTVLQ